MAHEREYPASPLLQEHRVFLERLLKQCRIANLPGNDRMIEMIEQALAKLPREAAEEGRTPPPAPPGDS